MPVVVLATVAVASVPLVPVVSVVSRAVLFAANWMIRAIVYTTPVHAFEYIRSMANMVPVRFLL